MGKKIEVDEEDFKLLVKKVTDLERKMEHKPETNITITPNEENYILECFATANYLIAADKQGEFQAKVNEFSLELKLLMKKYNFIKSSGVFLAKNIN